MEYSALYEPWVEPSLPEPIRDEEQSGTRPTMKFEPPKWYLDYGTLLPVRCQRGFQVPSADDPTNNPLAADTFAATGSSSYM